MKFFVIEGLDASGKSTQIEFLQRYLTNNKVNFKYLHFPRTDSPVYGELIARFLRGEFGNLNLVNPYLVALIYAGDRKDAAELIQSWLHQGYIVIADRYVHSNVAFQCAKIDDKNQREDLRLWINYLEYTYNKIPKPTLSLFLDVPFGFTRKKLSRKRRGNDRDYLKGHRDIHENDLTFQQKVRECYLWQVKDEPDFQIIDCRDKYNNMLPSDSIFQHVLDKLQLH
jgi:dTMP kinase